MKRLVFFLALLLMVNSILFAQNTKRQNTITVIDSLVKANNFNGTLLISKDSAITYHKSFGLANLQFQVRSNLTTKYKIASITKMFTAVLIMQFCEEHKIDLNGTVESYLPIYAGMGAGKVTVHQLLNHTSGLANLDTVRSIASALKNGIAPYQHPYTLDEFILKFCRDTLVSKPGTTFDYNNADYVILGKIIEKVSGKTYAEVLNERILAPLKMKNSGMLFQQDVIKGLADSYFFVDEKREKLVNDLPVYIQNWYAAGAMYSTTSDLLMFCKALFGLKLINKNSLTMMLTPGLEDYGYGVWMGEWKFKGRKYLTVQRPGKIMGAQTKLVHFPAQNITIIILSNTDTTDIDSLAYYIGRVIVDDKVHQ